MHVEPAAGTTPLDRDTPAASPARPGRSARTTLVVAALLLLWVLGGLAAVAFQAHERQMAEARAHNALLARVFADHVARNIDAASLASATMGELLLGGTAAEGAEFAAVMRQTLVNLPFLRGLAVVDADGVVRASTQRGEVGRQLDLAAFGALPGANTADALGRYVPGRGLLGMAAAGERPLAPPGVGFLPLLRRVALPHGGTVWLVALINADAFANFQQATLGPDAPHATALLSLDGHLVASTGRVAAPIRADLSGLEPFTRFLPRLEHGEWSGAGLQDGEQIAAFRVSASHALVLMVEEPRSAVVARWLSELRGLAIAGLAATLLIGVMTGIALRSVRSREAARRERDAAQQAVAQREQELSVTLQSVQELIFRTDAEGRLSFVNERWASFTGERARRPQRALWDAVAAPDRAAVQALFDPVGDTRLRRAQATLIDGRGSERCVEIAVMPLQRHGRLVGFAGSAVDVTLREQARRQLQDQLVFIEQLMDVSPLPTSVMTSAGAYVLVNKAWEDFSGRTRAEVAGTRVGSHLSSAEQRVHAAQDAALLASGVPRRYETRATHRDGSLRDVVVNKLLLPPEAGKPDRLMAVLVDVTEFRHAERATREARDAAEEASRAKSEFIANISHELRTPLQTILGFSQLGQMRGRDQPRLLAMFDDIHAAGQRMLNLVNDLLDVAKIESTVGTIHLERTDLRGLLHGVARELDPLLTPKRLRVELALPDEPLTARVDPARFQQVVRNVLANAIKVSPPGAAITLGAGTNAEGEPEVWVHDRGPGIPEAELDSIFEAFVQSSLTRDGSGGTGLGLAICRTIVQAHGGRIDAANRDGGGAAFRIRLPARGQQETMPAPL